MESVHILSFCQRKYSLEKQFFEKGKTMNRRNVNTRIESITPLESPDSFVARMPVLHDSEELVTRSREEIRRIISGEDDRMLVVAGPCSIHEERTGIEYAKRLAQVADKVGNRLLVVMRCYFEKPHTTIGWEGLVYDPHRDETFQVEEGMERARRFLLDVLGLGLPTATEWLDNLLPQYFADAVSWGAIGARSVEDQTHRRLPSGLSMPIGYKNGTGGTAHSVQIAVDAIVTAKARHAFLSTDENGRVSIVKTTGNPDGHIVLRGGVCGPNYSAPHITDAVQRLQKAGLPPFVMIDCSHGNSGKDHRMQSIVFRDVLSQRWEGNKNIMGIMLESNLSEGKQALNGSAELLYGLSITDSCIGWEETEALLMEAHHALSRMTYPFVH